MGMQYARITEVFFPYILNSWNWVWVSGKLQPGMRFLKWTKLHQNEQIGNFPPTFTYTHKWKLANGMLYLSTTHKSNHRQLQHNPLMPHFHSS